MKKYLRALLLLITPSVLLKLFNWRVGMSLILADTYKVGKECKIGHFNLIKCKELRMA